MTIEILILFSLIVFLAFAVKGSTGFAEGVIMVSLMALFMDIKSVLPVTAVISIVADLILLGYVKKNFNPGMLRYIFVGIVIGIIAGSLALNILESGLIRKLLAFFLILYSVKLFLDKNGVLKKVRKLWGAVAGFFSGLMDIIFGSPSPPLAIYLHHQIRNKTIFRSTIVIALLVSHSLRVASYLYSGLITADSFALSLYLLPALFMGVFAGIFVHPKISETAFKKMVGIIMLAIGGVLML